MIRFAFPAGLWLGLGALLVLAAYLIRRRARRVVVPFLPLWAVSGSRRGAGFGGALTRLLDLLLALLACLAAALAAGSPFVPGARESIRDLVLVVDGGLEAQAGGRLDRLRGLAEAEIRRRAPGTRFVLIAVADEGPQVWSGGDREEALAFVRAIRPAWLPGDRAEALDLAREGARTLREADVVLCTFRPGRPDGLRLRTLTDPIENSGIASVEVLTDAEGGGKIARLGLRGKGPVTLEGGLVGEGSVDVPLPASGRVALRRQGAPDGFSPDDAVYLILPERRIPRAVVIAAGEPSPFLTAALVALEETRSLLGPLERTTPDHAGAVEADLLIFDRCAPASALTGTRAIYLAPPPGALPFKVGEWSDSSVLLDVRRDHPLWRGFDPAAVPLLRARPLMGGSPLARAACGPVACEGPGWLALGFDPDRTVFAATPAYPLFLRNAIAHLTETIASEVPEFHAVGEPSPTSGVAEGADGQRWRVGDRLLGPPGFWTLGEATLAVNLVAPDLDLTSTNAPSDPLPAVGDPAIPDRPLAVHAAALGLVFLMLGWWVYWRR